MEKVIKQPLLIKPNKWWLVVQDEQGYVYDKFLTTKQYYKAYCLENFEEFIKKAKAGKIKLKQI